MMKKGIILIFFIFLISGCSLQIQKVCFLDKCFNVELADSHEKREIGLMNRSYLRANDGMLFVFEEENYYSFWMKDTLISLDIIWVNSNQEIIYIKEKALPCNLFQNNFNQKECEIIIPNSKAKYVLEINAGLVNELNLSLGDVIHFK